MGGYTQRTYKKRYLYEYTQIPFEIIIIRSHAFALGCSETGSGASAIVCRRHGVAARTRAESKRHGGSGRESNPEHGGTEIYRHGRCLRKLEHSDARYEGGRTV